MGFALRKVSDWMSDRFCAANEAVFRQRAARPLGLGAVGALGSSVALAEVPAAFTSAVTDITTNGTAMAGALVGVAAAVVVVMIALKFVKRLKSTV